MPHLAVFALAALYLIAKQPPGQAEDIPARNLEMEAALGRGLAAEFRRRTPALESTSVQDYLGRLGQRIAAQVHAASFPFAFTATAGDGPCSTIHVPATLPGGYVFVPAALLLAAQDEAEFAAMLAHAMAHIAKRHGIRYATPGAAANSRAVPLIFFGRWAGHCSELLPRRLQASRPAHSGRPPSLRRKPAGN